jgi:hypothetical protein
VSDDVSVNKNAVNSLSSINLNSIKSNNSTDNKTIINNDSGKIGDTVYYTSKKTVGYRLDPPRVKMSVQDFFSDISSSSSNLSSSINPLISFMQPSPQNESVFSSNNSSNKLIDSFSGSFVTSHYDLDDLLPYSVFHFFFTPSLFFNIKINK